VALHAQPPIAIGVKPIAGTENDQLWWIQHPTLLAFVGPVAAGVVGPVAAGGRPPQSSTLHVPAARR
jgi:hypothetical protein